VLPTAPVIPPSAMPMPIPLTMLAEPFFFIVFHPFHLRNRFITGFRIRYYFIPAAKKN
jgi:hypothetical protein